MISTLSEEECPQYKVILLGQSQAGKTKLLVRYLFGSYEDSGIQTHMVDCSYVRKAGAKFAYYDTAGQEVYRVILNIYLKGTDAALLLYNMESMDSLKELGYYHKRVTEEIPNALLFVVGCKSDLPITAPIEMAKQKYRAEGYFETSAKLNTGVAELFGRVQEELIRKNAPSSIGLGGNRFSLQSMDRKKQTKNGKKIEKGCCK